MKKLSLTVGGPPPVQPWNGAPADESCRVTRVSQHGQLRLIVWTCSTPAPSWSRSRFRPGRFAAPRVRAWWPGAVAAYYDGDAHGHRVQLVVYDGGPVETRRLRPARFDERERWRWVMNGERRLHAERTSAGALERWLEGLGRMPGKDL